MRARPWGAVQDFYDRIAQGTASLDDLQALPATAVPDPDGGVSTQCAASDGQTLSMEASNGRTVSNNGQKPAHLSEIPGLETKSRCSEVSQKPVLPSATPAKPAISDPPSSFETTAPQDSSQEFQTSEGFRSLHLTESHELSKFSSASEASDITDLPDLSDASANLNRLGTSERVGGPSDLPGVSEAPANPNGLWTPERAGGSSDLPSMSEPPANPNGLGTSENGLGTSENGLGSSERQFERRNFKIQLAYSGRHFWGWQKQRGHETVQE
jgi:hypothetical protein